jgi:hypothetical protein
MSWMDDWHSWSLWIEKDETSRGLCHSYIEVSRRYLKYCIRLFVYNAVSFKISYSRFSIGIAVMPHIRSYFAGIVVSYLVHKGITRTQEREIPSECEWFQMERHFV